MRIPYLKFEDIEDKEFAETWRNRDMDSALSHMVGHAEGFMMPLTELNGIVCAYNGEFRMDRTHRELAAVHASVLCGCRYMSAMHSLAALGHGGATDAQVAALQVGDIDSDAFDDAEKLVLKFTTEVVKNVKASDATMKAMRKTFTDRQIVEFTILIGTRMVYCQIAENAGVAPEDNALYDDVWKDANYDFPYRGLRGQLLGGGHPEK